MHQTAWWIFKTPGWAGEWLAVYDITPKSQMFDLFHPGRTLVACEWDVTNMWILLYLCQLKNTTAAPRFQAPPHTPCQSPSLPFPSLYLLISVGFSTKNHLGMAICQLRRAITQKRQPLFNICVPGSKTFLFTPLNTHYTHSFFLFSLPYLSTSHCLTSFTVTWLSGSKLNDPPPPHTSPLVSILSTIFLALQFFLLT